MVVVEKEVVAVVTWRVTEVLAQHLPQHLHQLLQPLPLLPQVSVPPPLRPLLHAEPQPRWHSHPPLPPLLQAVVVVVVWTRASVEHLHQGMS